MPTLCRGLFISKILLNQTKIMYNKGITIKADKRMSTTIFTIGHGTKTTLELIKELKLNGIQAVADVRSTPYSKYNPQHNREVLKSQLLANGIGYRHIPALGGRYSEKPNTPEWQSALQIIQKEAGINKIAIMCSESDPFKMCHRHLWIEPDLIKNGCNVIHILKGGKTKATVRKAEQVTLI